MQLKDTNKQRTTEAQGPAPTREVGNLVSPEWCQIPDPGGARKKKEGRTLFFFLWHREAKRERIWSDHKS